MVSSKVCLAFMVLTFMGTSALRMPMGESGWVNGKPESGLGKGIRDLALMHVPYNFGHTIEKVAMFPPEKTVSDMFAYMSMSGGLFTSTRAIPWSVAKKHVRRGGEIWGHLNPDLMVRNNVTGCDTYFSPQKYWPQNLADKYFGNKTIFGMLRDPAERLVAMFRGNVVGYGGGWNPRSFAKCDVNGAVKHMLKAFKASGNKFYQDCTFLPQAEFFEGRYGITMPVDNRRFPASMNEVFKEHGYTGMHVATRDILHVRSCENVWAEDLDAETRAMIREVYAKDYELLCKHFNYCDPDENTCISGVPQMCPSKVQKAMHRKQHGA